MPRFTRADIRKILGEAHTEEIENQIMALHLGVVDAIKDELSKAKADADKLPEVQAELDKLKEGKSNDNSYKAKYEKEHSDFEKYKAEQAAKDTKAEKTAKYRDLLKRAGVADKRLDAVLKVSDIDGLKLDKDGNIEDSDRLIASIKSDWSDFVVKEESKGANTDNPPANGGTKMTKAEIIAIKDAAERQKAIAENHNLFGF